MMEPKCPCSVDVGEKIGTVDDFVRAAILSAPKERTVDEVLGKIWATVKVEVKRWDAAKLEYGQWILHFEENRPFEDLLTNGGRDLIHNASFMTGAQPAALTYYAICNPGSFSPGPTDTTLNTEITTPSGLARHQCTGVVDGVTESFTHTASGNTTIVVCGFKNNSAGPITGIKGYGNFNAAGPPPAGTLGTESSFATLDLNINDILKLTVTLTLG